MTLQYHREFVSGEQYVSQLTKYFSSLYFVAPSFAAPSSKYIFRTPFP
jgi:hypothetical protein